MSRSARSRDWQEQPPSRNRCSELTFYSFDTSSILNGHRDLLPASIFPSLWKNVEGMIRAGNVRAVEVVLDELSRRDDHAHSWARSQERLFLPLDLDVQSATRRVLAEHPRLMGVGGGRNGADPFVIGLALASGGTVVTEERLTGNTSRPRIPDVCEALGVRWLPLIRFVAEQGWSF
ncbi:DUF4411 family protein [Kitasatospora xanthocidica]|uniref:DUF4411 family protein n=1 Tax=Kitasatospora xanthocidica TaxID=83382 RepID=UPI0036E09161